MTNTAPSQTIGSSPSLPQSYLHDLCVIFRLTDVGSLHWGHAVNTIQLIHTAVDEGCHMLEADIQYDLTQQQAIMAHDAGATGPTIQEVE